MNDISYKLKVMESRVYGLRDAMVSNAKTYNKFREEVLDTFGILRKRITRVENRENYDRLLIYALIMERVCTKYFEKRKREPKITRKNFYTSYYKNAKND